MKVVLRAIKIPGNYDLLASRLFSVATGHLVLMEPGFRHKLDGCDEFVRPVDHVCPFASGADDPAPMAFDEAVLVDLGKRVPFLDAHGVRSIGSLCLPGQARLLRDTTKRRVKCVSLCCPTLPRFKKNLGRPYFLRLADVAEVPLYTYIERESL
jgi:hypothetical protein